jgi:pSer/pThr/pTyr-binding forkhead associated (FHA) protein
MRSWVFGSSADCDVVVDSPLASGRHCQLTQSREGFFLEDLGSTNGTYVNGTRITSTTRVTPGEPITLGRTVPMPWPPEVVTFIRIGRLEDNEIVLDDPRVSGHHARLIVVAGSQTLIEDLGSSNGTFLNSADQPITRVMPVADTDTVYFGSLAVPAARLLAERKEAEEAATVPSPRSAGTEPRPEPTSARPAKASFEANRWILALLAQAPILAVVIVLIFGTAAAAPITDANWPAAAQSIASVTFALALAAIWLGCSFAMGELVVGRMPGRTANANSGRSFLSLSSRLVFLAALCAVGCALLLAIVYWWIGLKGPWLSIWGVLVMASLVGLLLGLAVSALVPDRATTAAVLLICFVPMVALGGRLWPLPSMSPPLQLAAAALPSRWAFEGVLLLESDCHPAPTIPEGSSPTQNRDLAENFFPANSERMGTKADAMALGSILIGLAVVAAFTSRLFSRLGP